MQLFHSTIIRLMFRTLYRICLLLKRDSYLRMRGGGELTWSAVFLIFVAMLFPVTLGSDKELLFEIAPGVVWICVLLAVLVPMERLYGEDFHDGTLEQFVLVTSADVVFLIRVLSWWLWMLPPLAVGALVCLVFYDLRVVHAADWLRLACTFLMGTLALNLVGGVVAASALGTQKGTFLVLLLAVPLAVPVLLFSIASTQAILVQQESPALLALLGVDLGLLALAPGLGGMALRQALT